MQDKQITGKLGETMAAAYLQQKGYTIVHRNYRHRRAEVDLIALNGRLLVFVEVKTRRGTNRFGYPEEAVDHKKAALITGAAEHYVVEHDWQGDIRFDIIAIQLPAVAAASPHIHHFEDAFY